MSSSDLTNDPVSPGLDVERVKSSCDILSNQFSNINISDSNNHGSIKQKECNSMAEHKEIKYISWGLLDSYATSHAATDSVSMRGGDLFEASPTPSETCNLHSENGTVDVRNDTIPPYHGMSAKQYTGRSDHYFEDAKHNAYSYSAGLADGLGTSNSVLTSDISEPGGTANDMKMPDLAGDFDTNFHNLLYAQGCQQDNTTPHLYYPMPSAPSLQYQNMHPSNGHGRKNLYGYAGRSGVVPGPIYPPGYFMLRPVYQTDDHMPVRARGTGTYFPDPVRSLTILMFL